MELHREQQRCDSDLNLLYHHLFTLLPDDVKMIKDAHNIYLTLPGTQRYGISIANPSRAFVQSKNQEPSFCAEFAITKDDGFCEHERYEDNDGIERFYSSDAILIEINEIAKLSRENKL